MDQFQPSGMETYDGTKSPYRMRGAVNDRFLHPSYMLKKRIWRFFGSAVRIYSPDGQLAFYVERKAFKLKDDIRIYADEAMTTELMSINARQVLDLLGTFDVRDSRSGQIIGTLQRRNVISAFRDQWFILDEVGNQTGVVIEDSLALALIRDFLFAFLPRAFHIEHAGTKVGVLRHRITFLGNEMTMEFMDGAPGFDRRLGIAAAIVIALIESGRRRG